jgi:hypothetical protein
MGHRWYQSLVLEPYGLHSANSLLPKHSSEYYPPTCFLVFRVAVFQEVSPVKILCLSFLRLTIIPNSLPHQCYVIRTSPEVSVYVVRSQVLTAASMKMTAFWDIALCSLVEVDRRFRGAYWLHPHIIDDGGSKRLWNVGQILLEYTAQHPRNSHRHPNTYQPGKAKLISYEVIYSL